MLISSIYLIPYVIYRVLAAYLLVLPQCNAVYFIILLPYESAMLLSEPWYSFIKVCELVQVPYDYLVFFICLQVLKHSKICNVLINLVPISAMQQLVALIGSMSPWVLPERTLGTVQYTETYPSNYLICRTVPSLLQTVPSFETRIPDHRDICKRIARISVYRLKFLLGFTVSYSNPTL